MDSVKLYCLMERPTGIVCKLSTTAQELFSSFPDPFCQRQSASSSLVRKSEWDCFPLFEGRNDKMPYLFLENKKGMVSLGFCCEGSGKPAILSTTAYQAKSHSKSWANAQRPTPDRCERSSYSQVAGFRPRKIYQTFRSRNKSTTLIQYVTRNIYKENGEGIPRKWLKWKFFATKSGKLIF